MIATLFKLLMAPIAYPIGVFVAYWTNDWQESNFMGANLGIPTMLLSLPVALVFYGLLLKWLILTLILVFMPA